MRYNPDNRIFPGDIRVTEEVLSYIRERGCNFRICTTCGGPILLPVSLKPPKDTDLTIKAGSFTIYISIHQARYLHTIHMGLVPHLLDREFDQRGSHAVRRAASYGGCTHPGESGEPE